MYIRLNSNNRLDEAFTRLTQNSVSLRNSSFLINLANNEGIKSKEAEEHQTEILKKTTVKQMKITKLHVYVMHFVTQGLAVVRQWSS